MGIVKKRRKFSITTEKDGGDADVEDEDDADDDETIIEEVKQRLSRCRCRWLAVFDNLEVTMCVCLFVFNNNNNNYNNDGDPVRFFLPFKYTKHN